MFLETLFVSCPGEQSSDEQGACDLGKSPYAICFNTTHGVGKLFVLLGILALDKMALETVFGELFKFGGGGRYEVDLRALSGCRKPNQVKFWAVFFVSHD